MIVVVNIGVNRLSQRRNAVKFLQIEAFGFERAEKTFSHCVIEAVALSRHALHHACCPEPVLISRHLILPALVGVQHGRIPGVSRVNALSSIVSTSAITGLSDRLYAITSLLKASITGER